MATIQQSIEIKVPVHTAYQCLIRFEEYPRFMGDVESVRRIDDTHLHWTTKMANRPVEWDAEITEQEPDRSIAWHNTGGPSNAGKVELQASGADTSQVTFTLQSEPQQVPGSVSGYTEDEMAQRLEQDLARLKDFIEAPGSEADRTQREFRNAAGSGGDTGAEQRQRGNGPAGDHAPIAAVVGASGGTDAAAGARLSGSKGGPGGPGLRQNTDAAGAPGTPGGEPEGNAASPAAGAGAAGGTGLGSTATADDTRTGTGSTSGSGTALTGGGTSGARDAGVSAGKGNPPNP